MRDLIDIVRTSTLLALRGELVQDLWNTLLRAAAASIAGAAVGIATITTGGSLWLAALVGGLLAGMLAPFLLRNIKVAR
jgi:hypothetical protein